jgi:hypothetical protein
MERATPAAEKQKSSANIKRRCALITFVIPGPRNSAAWVCIWRFCFSTKRFCWQNFVAWSSTFAFSGIC